MSQIDDGGHERREKRRIYHRTRVARRQELGLHDDHLEQENGDAQDGAKLEPNRYPAEPCASLALNLQRSALCVRTTGASREPTAPPLDGKGVDSLSAAVTNSLAPRIISSGVQI